MSYKEQTDLKNIKAMWEIRDRLPSFMHDYFDCMTELRNTSPSTVLGYARDLETFCRYLSQKHQLGNISEITPELLDTMTVNDLTSYKSYLNNYTYNGAAHSNKEVTKARKISALRSFWHWAKETGVLSTNPTILMLSGSKLKKKDIVVLSEGEAEHLLQSAKSGADLTDGQRKYAKSLIARDVAIMTLFLGTGIRVSELVGIDMKDIDFDRNCVRITRKGGDESKVFFVDAVKETLLDYLQGKNKAPGDPLFTGKRGNRLTPRGVQYIVKKHVTATLPQRSDEVTPHKFRATYATAVYQQSGDIYLTSHSLGHKNIETTSHYTRIEESQREQAAHFAAGLISGISEERKKNGKA